MEIRKHSSRSKVSATQYTRCLGNKSAALPLLFVRCVATCAILREFRGRDSRIRRKESRGVQAARMAVNSVSPWLRWGAVVWLAVWTPVYRSEEHTSELQSQSN